MSIIKSFLFKIFNKEFSFTNNNLSKLLNFNSDTQLTSLSEIINDYEKYLLFESEGKVKKVVISHPPVEKRQMFLIIVFPQFKDILIKDLDIEIELLET